MTLLFPGMCLRDRFVVVLLASALRPDDPGGSGDPGAAGGPGGTVATSPPGQPPAEPTAAPTSSEDRIVVLDAAIHDASAAGRSTRTPWKI